MNRKIVTTTIIFSTLFCGTIKAQNSERYTGSLLWRVSGNGLEAASYIFGTHHLADISITDSVAGFDEAFNEVVQVVGELDMSDPTIQTKLQRAMIIPSEYSYEQILSGEDYEFMDEKLRETLGAGLEQLGQLHPAAITSFYSIACYAKLHEGFDMMSHVAIDRYIQDLARQHGKSVIGIETVKDQINALYNSEPIDKITQSLLCLLRNDEDMVKQMELLNQYYAEGKLYQAFDLAFTEGEYNPCPFSEVNSTALLDNRNAAWLEKLPVLFADGSTLLAVGALHLAGYNGILAGLERMGYTVEPVK